MPEFSNPTGFDGTVFHRFGRCRHSIPAVVETHTRFPAFVGMTTVDVFGSPVAGWVVRWFALQTVRNPHVKTAIARAAVAVLMAAKFRPGALSRERYGLLPRSTKRMRDTGKHRLVGMRRRGLRRPTFLEGHSRTLAQASLKVRGRRGANRLADDAASS